VTWRIVRFARTMRYPGGGGLTAAERARRERVRLTTAELTRKAPATGRRHVSAIWWDSSSIYRDSTLVCLTCVGPTDRRVNDQSESDSPAAAMPRSN
jgi:hypothetical protein